MLQKNGVYGKDLKNSESFLTIFMRQIAKLRPTLRLLLDTRLSILSRNLTYFDSFEKSKKNIDKKVKISYKNTGTDACLLNSQRQKRV